MATTIASFIATIPAGTSPFSPHTVTLDVGTNEVERIRWRVPPGPRGNLGWYLAMGGVQVLPNKNGTAIVADNEWDEWVLDALPDSGVWQLVGYNTGTFDHSVYLEFFTSPVSIPSVVTVDFLAGFPFDDAAVAGMWLA